MWTQSNNDRRPADGVDPHRAAFSSRGASRVGVRDEVTCFPPVVIGAHSTQLARRRRIGEVSAACAGSGGIAPNAAVRGGLTARSGPRALARPCVRGAILHANPRTATRFQGWAPSPTARNTTVLLVGLPLTAPLSRRSRRCRCSFLRCSCRVDRLRPTSRHSSPTFRRSARADRSRRHIAGRPCCTCCRVCTPGRALRWRRCPDRRRCMRSRPRARAASRSRRSRIESPFIR